MVVLYGGAYPDSLRQVITHNRVTIVTGDKSKVMLPFPYQRGYSSPQYRIHVFLMTYKNDFLNKCVNPYIFHQPLHLVL